MKVVELLETNNEWANNPKSPESIQRVFKARLLEFERFSNYLSKKYPKLRWAEYAWKDAELQKWTWVDMNDTLVLNFEERKIISKKDQLKYKQFLERLVKARKELDIRPLEFQ